jgi:two-component system phosphate regulon response regulator PhoB
VTDKRIAIVEDDHDIADLLEHSLDKAGFHVDVFRRGDTAAVALAGHPPDLILLDLMLPGMDGLELCKELRRQPQTADVPLVMLTARTEETDRIVGLELGADDYITKPFSPREVVLRVKAVLRRHEREPAVARAGGRIAFGELAIDPERHEVQVSGEPVGLTATEFKLLAFIAERADRVQRREKLLSEVWGYSSGVDSRTVDTHVRRLRRKLGVEADRIETVIGVGYRFRS